MLVEKMHQLLNWRNKSLGFFNSLFLIIVAGCRIKFIIFKGFFSWLVASLHFRCGISLADRYHCATSNIFILISSGFGLLEAGCVSPKNEINIMIKNALDVIFGGLAYWAVGFGLSFGRDPGSNGFVGVGNFFLSCNEEDKGYLYALFLFQLSFSTTSTTIVSGAMAERTRLLTYNIFSMLNTFIYSIPAHWVWAEAGFLFKLGVIDVAGCGPVHLVGGVTGLVATIMLGPRKSAVPALKKNEKIPIPSSVKCILGMFMLWWVNC